MKEAYCTVLSSEDFTIGVKALHKSLSLYSSKEFVVFVSSDIEGDTVNSLRDKGITIIRADEPDIPQKCISERQAADRWNKTLYKLICFRPNGYDKLVYLDSDILVRADLDDLFELEGFAAVSDSKFYPEFARGGINSGVMVIEPSEELYNNLRAMVPVVAAEMPIFGDQDVINKYLMTNGHSFTSLSVEYNTCFYACKGIEDPKVVHFILKSKPWNWSWLVRTAKIIKWGLKGKKRQIKYLREYMGIINLVKK